MDGAAEGDRPGYSDVLLDDATVRRFHGADDAEKRRFSRSVQAEDPHILSARERGRNIVENLVPAGSHTIGFGYVV